MSAELSLIDRHRAAQLVHELCRPTNAAGVRRALVDRGQLVRTAGTAVYHRPMHPTSNATVGL